MLLAPPLCPAARPPRQAIGNHPVDDVAVGNETAVETHEGWYELRNALEVHYEQAFKKGLVKWPKTAKSLGLTNDTHVFEYEEEHGEGYDEAGEAGEEEEGCEDGEEEEEEEGVSE